MDTCINQFDDTKIERIPVIIAESLNRRHPVDGKQAQGSCILVCFSAKAKNS
jgi:hypothetical protein